MAMRGKKYVTALAPNIIRKWLKSRKLRRIDLADLMGVCIQTVDYWLDGRQRPGLSTMFVLETLVPGCTVPKWLTEEERERVNTRRRKIGAIRQMKPRKEPDLIDRVAGRL